MEQVAQQYFQLLGASASECDTIPGRQCMASCFFILRQACEYGLDVNALLPLLTLTFGGSLTMSLSTSPQLRLIFPMIKRFSTTTRSQRCRSLLCGTRTRFSACQSIQSSLRGVKSLSCLQAAAGKYKEAEPALLSLHGSCNTEELQRDYIFQMWLARCLVMNGKARQVKHKPRSNPHLH